MAGYTRRGGSANVRVDLDDLVVPATLYVDNVTGDDANSGGSVGAPLRTLSKAFEKLPTNSRLARTIQLAASATAYSWPALTTSMFSWVTIDCDLLAIETGLTVSSIGTSSKANGITITVTGGGAGTWTVDQHKGRIIKYVSGHGVLNGTFGRVVSNTASTLTVTIDRRGAYTVPTVAGTVEVYEEQASVDFPDGQSNVIESSVALTIRGVKFTGTTKTLFVNDTDNVTFQRCRFDLMNVIVGRGGSADFRCCYIRNIGTATQQNGMIAANTQGVMRLSDGTVVDAAGAAVGNAHVKALNYGGIEFVGEVVFLRLGTRGVLLRSCSWVTSVRSLSSDCVARFLDTCVGGWKFNSASGVTGGEGAGGGGDLPESYGTVTDSYAVTGTRCNAVRLGAGSSLVAGVATNAVSANDGSTNVATATDGTYLSGGSPAAP